MTDVIALDFFTVPTVGSKAPFVPIVPGHNRRKGFHFNVTAHPTAQWTAQQLVEAFSGDTAPNPLLRDHDAAYSAGFQQRGALWRAHALAAPWSGLRHAVAERLIGSIRWELWSANTPSAARPVQTAYPRQEVAARRSIPITVLLSLAGRP